MTPEEQLKRLRRQIKETHIGSPEERELIEQIEVLEASLATSSSPPQSTRPPQLLLRAEHFVGREEELAKLVEDLQPGRVVTLCGPGGIGKTALAAEAVERLTERGELTTRFPDGVIVYSFYGQPDPMLAFAHIIRSFDPDAREISAQAAQAMLMHKQALLILDGTEEAEDVQRVLNIRGSCGVLVTSRRKADAVAERQDMPPLPIEDTVNLLRAWGGERAGEGEATHRLCEQLGGLPLAARLAGRYLSQTGETAAEYLNWLDTSPFEALHQGIHREESVNLLLERSVQQVSENARRVLAVVGMLAFAPFTEPPLATALNVPIRDVRTALGHLVNYGLLIRPNDRYEVSHALIHTYARQCLTVAPDTLRRLAAHYAAFANAQGTQGTAGYLRLNAERAHLLRVVEHCQERQEWQAVVQLVLAFDEYLDIQGYWTERAFVLSSGLDAMMHLDNRRGQVVCLGNMGNVCRDLGQMDRAIDFYGKAITLAQKFGERGEEGTWLGCLGLLYTTLGLMEEAIRSHEQALTIARETGNHQGEEAQLNNLGLACWAMGQMEQAIHYYDQALALSREHGNRQGESKGLGNLGNVYIQSGQHERAIAYYEQALALSRENGDAFREKHWLTSLGLVCEKSGQNERAIACYEQALSIARTMGDRREEGVQLGSLGDLYQAMKQVDRAIEYYMQALTLAREIGDLRNMSNWSGRLGIVHHQAGQLAQAMERYLEAFNFACEICDRRSISHWLGCLGLLCKDAGLVEQAISFFRQALALLEDIKSPDAAWFQKCLTTLEEGS